MLKTSARRSLRSKNESYAATSSHTCRTSLTCSIDQSDQTIFENMENTKILGVRWGAEQALNWEEDGCAVS